MAALPFPLQLTEEPARLEALALLVRWLLPLRQILAMEAQQAQAQAVPQQHLGPPAWLGYSESAAHQPTSLVETALLATAACTAPVAVQLALESLPQMPSRLVLLAVKASPIA